MPFSFSGRAAQGAHDNLQELLAAQLAEEMSRADQAQQDRQLGQQDERIGLDREQLAQQAAQHADTMGLSTRRQDFVETERGADIEQDSLDRLRTGQDATRDRMTKLQEQEDQESVIANAPADVRPVIEGLIRSGGKPTARDFVSPADADKREREMIEFQARTEAKYREPRVGSGGGGGGATAEAAQTATAKALSTLQKLDDLSARVNTQEDGLMARGIGLARTGAAKMGYDPDVNEYVGLIGIALPQLARQLGHVGVLTQQDVDSVLAGLPNAQSTAEERNRKIANVRDLITGGIAAYEARTGQTLGGGVQGPPATGGGPGGGQTRRKFNPATGQLE